MKQYYKSLDEIRQDLDLGVYVYWVNSAYQAIYEADHRPDWKRYSSDGKNVISIRCMSNWFGSIIEQNEVTKCYKIED